MSQTDSDFLIRIRTILEAGGADAAKKELDGLIAKGREASTATGGQAAVASYDRIRDAIAQAGSSGQNFVKSAVAGIEGLSPAAGAAIAGIGGIVLAWKAASESLQAFAEKQENVAALDAVLAQQGQLTDDYRVKLQELAQQLQDTTAVADDQWLQVLMRLTQFGADNTNINQYTEAVKNLAGIIGGDVVSASHLFSRAMQGSFESFARYGIHVEDAGTQTEKLDKLMQQLAQRGAGVLEAKAQTVTGQFRQMKFATEELGVAVGKIVANTGLVAGFTGAIKDMADGLKNLAGGDVIQKLDGLENKLQNGVVNAAEKAAKEFSAMSESSKKNIDSVSSAIDAQTKRITDQITSWAELEKAKIRFNAAQTNEAPEQTERKLRNIDLIASGKTNEAEKSGVQRKINELEVASFPLMQEAVNLEIAAKEAEERAARAVKARREKLLDMSKKVSDLIDQGADDKPESDLQKQQLEKYRKIMREIRPPSQADLFPGGKVDYRPSQEEEEAKKVRARANEAAKVYQEQKTTQYDPQMAGYRDRLEALKKKEEADRLNIAAENKAAENKTAEESKRAQIGILEDRIKETNELVKQFALLRQMRAIELDLAKNKTPAEQQKIREDYSLKAKELKEKDVERQLKENEDQARNAHGETEAARKALADIERRNAPNSPLVRDARRRLAIAQGEEAPVQNRVADSRRSLAEIKDPLSAAAQSIENAFGDLVPAVLDLKSRMSAVEKMAANTRSQNQNGGTR